jgi:hypothetical protein
LFHIICGIPIVGYIYSPFAVIADAPAFGSSFIFRSWPPRRATIAEMHPLLEAEPN